MKGRTSTIVRRGWIASVLGYSALRFVVAWGALSRYGVDPLVFAVLDLATAYPYAHATAELVASAWSGRGDRAAAWALVALVMFVAPYGYVLAAGGAMPGSVRLTVVAVAVAMAAVVGTGLLRRSRAGGHALVL